MKNLIYPAFALLSGICGLLTGQGALLLLAVVLLLVTGLSAFLVRHAAGNVQLELQVPAVTGKGKPFPVEVKLTEKGRLPIGPVHMTLVCRNRLTGKSIRRKITGSERAFTLTEQYCGCLELALEQVKIYDWTGVILVSGKDTVPRRVLVMPDTFPLEAAPRLSVSNLMDSEEYSPYKKGQDPSETFQIREYIPGDSLHQIHWKLSSKMDHLMVRDASLPVDPSLLLFWDRRMGHADPKLADAMCEAFVSLAQAYAEAGISCRIAWNGETIHMVDITGEEQLAEAVAELLKTENPESELSGAELYTGTCGRPDAGRILYLAGSLPEGLAAFGGHADLRLLYCSKEGDAPEETEEGIPVSGFTPETMEEEMQLVCME